MNAVLEHAFKCMRLLTCHVINLFAYYLKMTVNLYHQRCISWYNI